MTQNAAKKAVGKAAAALVHDGQCVGLGTGSTTAFAIMALGRRIRAEGLRIVGTPTSSAAARLARKHHIPMQPLDGLTALDIALDGADEVDPDFNLIKGRGAAHTREKVIARLARRFVVLVDSSKHVAALGSGMPVPVEVLPMAASPVMDSLAGLGARPVLRLGVRKDGPVVTDQGLWIVDAHFDGIDDLTALDVALKMISGVLDHGLFVGMATDIITGDADGRYKHQVRQDRPRAVDPN